MEFCLEQNCLPEQPSKEFHTSLVLIFNWKGWRREGEFISRPFLPNVGRDAGPGGRQEEEMAMWTVPEEAHSSPVTALGLLPEP